MCAFAAREIARLVLAALMVAALGLAPRPLAAGEAADGFEARFNVAALGPVALSEIHIPDMRNDTATAEPFGLGTDANAVLQRKWRDVELLIRAEMRIVARCRAEPAQCDSVAARRFVGIVKAAQQRSGRARIGEINRAINLAIRPADDMRQHGIADLWSSPLQTLQSLNGDCEDYAIAKFALLREAGFADADLRLVVVHESGAQSSHAVVAVKSDGRWLILDNRRLALVEDRNFQARGLAALRIDGETADETVLASLGGPGLLGAAPLLM